MQRFYHGQLVESAMNFVFALVFLGILIGAGAIALGSFASGQSGNAAAALNNASFGLLNMSIQLPTVGTIMGVGLIILVLFVAIGVYVMRRE